MQVSDLYYKKYLKYKNKYVNLQSQIGGGGPITVLPNFVLDLEAKPRSVSTQVLPLTQRTEQKLNININGNTYSEDMTTIQITKDFNDNDFLKFVRFLINITNLKTLTLNNIIITVPRATLLVQFLISCKQLETLNLFNNNMDNNSVDIIVPSLNSFSNLTTFKISSNDIFNKGGSTIANFLLTNRLLTTLELSRCNIGNGGGSAIANALSNNQSSLTTLNIEWNLIGDDTFIAFAEALKSNNILINLNISNSNQPRTTNAYIQLAEALKSNETLKTLNIKGINQEKDIILFKEITRCKVII